MAIHAPRLVSCLFLVTAWACGGVGPSDWGGGGSDSDGSGGAMTAGRGNEAAAGGLMLTLKQPVDRGGGKLVLELGSTYFEVTPGHGARITSLRHAGTELLWLKGASNYADALGSTFWPSPQTWPWPPPAEIDNGVYTASIAEGGAITARGQLNQDTSLRVTKRFVPNLEREAIDIEYVMANEGETRVSWAPWEITRMPANGLAFWPTGGAPFGPQPLVSQSAHGHSWCDPSKTEGEAKLFADGAGGYLAYLVGDRLLVKQFEDQPASVAAPGEAEIELYVNPDHSYIEVEHQGAYVSIDPGASVSWKVSWLVRRLPTGIAPRLGNPDLVAFVAQTLE